MNPVLESFGLDDEWRQKFAEVAHARASLGRIVSVHYGGSFVRIEDAVVLAVPRADARREKRGGDYNVKPAVGDWVSVRPNAAVVEDALTWSIEELLPRKTQIVRRGAGDRGAQIVAANVDRVIVCMTIGLDFNLRRLERYLALAAHAEVQAVVALTQCDRAAPEVLEVLLDGAQDVVGDTKLIALSAHTGLGLEALRHELVPGSTAVMIGSSGVGKSTLLNALAGAERMSTGSVRAKDEKGRHTTTHRELFQLPGAGLLIDTPGLREVGLVDEIADTRIARRRKR